MHTQKLVPVVKYDWWGFALLRYKSANGNFSSIFIAL